MRVRFVLASAVLWLVLLCGFGEGARGQPMPWIPDREGTTEPGPSTAAAEGGPTAAQLRQLVDLLEDPAVRRWLAGQIDAALGQQPEADVAAPPAGPLARALARMRAQIALVGTSLAAVPAEVEALGGLLARQLGGNRGGQVALAVLALGVVGFALERAYWRATAGYRARQRARSGLSARQRLGRMLSRLGHAAAAVAVSIAGAFFVLLAFDWPPLIEALVLAVLAGYVAIRLAVAAGRAVYDPADPSMRFLPISTPRAAQLQRWTVVLVAVAAVGFLLADLLDRSALTPHLAFLAFALAVLGTILVFVGATWAGYRVRREEADGESAAEAPGAAEPTPQVPPQGVPILRTVLFLLAWGLWFVGTPVLPAVILAALLVPPVLTGSRVATQGLLRDPEDPDRLLPLTPATVAVERGLRGAALLGTLLLIGADWSAAASGDAVADRLSVVGVLTQLLVVYVVGDILWQVSRVAIDQRIAREAGLRGLSAAATGPGPAPAVQGSRLRTLLPLLRNVIFITIVVVGLMIALTEMGVNVGPLIAGAGIVGIAIGFGANSLVRDIFSGMFFLIDDAFRVGEYVEIGNLRGTVERISIRSMTLRNQNGPLLTIPFGEVRSITNHSRDWVIMKLQFRVPFETDMDLVKKLVKRIGQEIAADPVLSDGLLDTVKSQGVRFVDEFNMVIGVKFMARPGKQFVLRREVYQRVLAAFEANGIRLASREVHVRGPAEPAGPALPALEAGAASIAAERR